MSKSKTLTKAEEEIMQFIWQLERCTVSNIIDEMKPPKPPHSSVSTIVRILEKKGFVSHKTFGRTYEYYPLLSKEEYGKRSLGSLIRNYFNGSPADLVSFLVSRDETSIEELQELIISLKKKNNSK